MKNNKKFFLKVQLTLAVSVLVVLLISGFFIFGPSLSQVAEALTGAYNRSALDTELTIADWNLLDEDFIAKSGDTMEGNLNMNGNRITNIPDTPSNGSDAVNQNYVLATVSAGSINDTTGSTIKAVCGETTPGATNWQQTAGVTDVVWVDVNTTAAGFAPPPAPAPMYFTNLSGNTMLFRTYGVTSVYFPTYTGFRVYIVNAQGNVDPSLANSWGWYIKWCGFGQ